MAAALVNRRAVDSGSSLRALSAGFETENTASPPETVKVMAQRGIDLAEHRSQVVTAEMLDASDLVIGMVRSHIWDAAILEPSSIPHAYVFGEFVRLNRLAGGREQGEKFEDWVTRLHSARRVLTTDEVLDPFGRRLRIHERAARQLERLVLELADCAFDPAVPDHDDRWREGKLIWRP
jgi:protein-tyrosine-phosphatase